MDATPFFVVMSAVAAANILSFGMIWSLFQMVKDESKGGEARTFHLIVVAVTGFFIAGGIYLASIA